MKIKIKETKIVGITLWCIIIGSERWVVVIYVRISHGGKGCRRRGFG